MGAPWLRRGVKSSRGCQLFALCCQGHLKASCVGQCGLVEVRSLQGAIGGGESVPANFGTAAAGAHAPLGDVRCGRRAPARPSLPRLKKGTYAAKCTSAACRRLRSSRHLAANPSLAGPRLLRLAPPFGAVSAVSSASSRSRLATSRRPVLSNCLRLCMGPLHVNALRPSGRLGDRQPATQANRKSPQQEPDVPSATSRHRQPDRIPRFAGLLAENGLARRRPP